VEQGRADAGRRGRLRDVPGQRADAADAAPGRGVEGRTAHAADAAAGAGPSAAASATPAAAEEGDVDVGEPDVELAGEADGDVPERPQRVLDPADQRPHRQVREVGDRQVDVEDPLDHLGNVIERIE